MWIGLSTKHDVALVWVFFYGQQNSLRIIVEFIVVTSPIHGVITGCNFKPNNFTVPLSFFGENVWDRFQEFTGSKVGKCSTVDFLT